MILAIDVGNTHTVLGCIEEGEIRFQSRIRTLPKATETEYAIKLMDVLAYWSIAKEGFAGAILASVVPPVTQALAGAVESVIGLGCLVVGPGMKTGLNIRIDDPGTLGADLLTGSVAAVACYGMPAIIIDMGTATTLAAVDASGAFRGGAILPGVKLGMEALASGTSLLPDIAVSAPPKAIGANTVDSMRSGAIFGAAAALDGMIDRMETELGQECRLIATGGLASSVVPHCRRQILCDDDLLMKGLWVLYQKNR